MLKKIGLAIFCVLPFTETNAQDSTKKTSVQFSGSADAYYRYDVNQPKSPFNNFTSFTTSQNSFELGMISLKAEHTIGKVGMVADIGFGKRADEFSYNDTKSSVAIKQLFVSYAPSSKVKFTFGSWDTHIGYESVDATSNRNYSMSYMFSYGPFFHTGIKTDILMKGKTSLMIGIANPDDMKYASNFPKTVIAQISSGSKDDKIKLFINYQGGKNNDSGRLYQEDLVVNYTISDVWSLGYNGTIQSRQARNLEKWETFKTWSGNALYINSNPEKWLAFCLRTELLNDRQNVLGFNGNIFETTFSTNFLIDNLTIVPEFRFENASQKIYAKADGTNINNTGNFLLAVVYKF